MWDIKVHPRDLSENARKIYEKGGSSLSLDRDWLKPDAHRLSEYAFEDERKLDENFVLEGDFKDAVDEIVEAGLGDLSFNKDQLLLVNVNTEFYDEFHGDGFWDIQVFELDENARANRVLLAQMYGADFFYTGSTVGEANWNFISTSVSYIVDLDGKRSSSSYVAFSLCSPLSVYGNKMTFRGVPESIIFSKGDGIERDGDGEPVFYNSPDDENPVAYSSGKSKQVKVDGPVLEVVVRPAERPGPVENPFKKISED